MFDATFQPQLGGPQAAAALASAIDEYKQNQQMGAYTDAIVKHAAMLTRPDGSSYLTPDDLVKFDQMSGPQKKGFAAAVGANMMDDNRRQLQQQQVDARADSPYAQTAIWADDGTGRQVQVGSYDSKGTPHYFPYGHAGGAVAPSFTPPQDAASQMGNAGYTYAPTSIKSGRWINTKGNADLGEDGMPIYSKDGTMVQSGGKMKPITQPMVNARMMGGMAVGTPTPAATPAPAAQSIKVKHPNGAIGYIPAAQLPDAITQGYQQVQ